MTLLTTTGLGTCIVLVLGLAALAAAILPPGSARHRTTDPLCTHHRTTPHPTWWQNHQRGRTCVPCLRAATLHTDLVADCHGNPTIHQTPRPRWWQA